MSFGHYDGCHLIRALVVAAEIITQNVASFPLLLFNILTLHLNLTLLTILFDNLIELLVNSFLFRLSIESGDRFLLY